MLRQIAGADQASSNTALLLQALSPRSKPTATIQHNERHLVEEILFDDLSDGS
jgi:hypothetical protein